MADETKLGKIWYNAVFLLMAFVVLLERLIVTSVRRCFRIFKK